ERHAHYAADVTLEREGFLPGPCVPELHRTIMAGGGDASFVGAERNAFDQVGVTLERGCFQTGAGVPGLARAIATGGGGSVAGGAERHAHHVASVTLEREGRLRGPSVPDLDAWKRSRSDCTASLLTGPGVPDHDHIIIAGRGDATSVGAKRHAVGVTPERAGL